MSDRGCGSENCQRLVCCLRTMKKGGGFCFVLFFKVHIFKKKKIEVTWLLLSPVRSVIPNQGSVWPGCEDISHEDAHGQHPRGTEGQSDSPTG